MDKVYRDSGRMWLDNGESRITDADGKAMGSMPLEDGDRLLAQHRRREGRPGPRADDARGLDDPPRGLDAARLRAPDGHRRRRRGPRARQRPVDHRLAPDRPRERLVRPGRGGHPDPARAPPTRRWSTAACSSSPTSSPGSAPSRSSRRRTRRSSTRRSAATLADLHGARPQEPVVRGRVARSRATGSAARPARRRSGTREHKRWFFNIYNFSCVGFIGRDEGHPGPRRRGQDRRGAAEPERARASSSCR